MSILTETTPESPLVVFYQFYSYFTLGCCWTMSPVMFYVIITQSQNIGHFKWLILNHSIWCLCLETLIGVVKPVLLTPAYGGYQVGLLSSFTDYMSSGVTVLLCTVLTVNTVFGVMISIISRYTVIFPSRWQRLFQKRETYLALILVYLMFDVFLVLMLRPILESTDNDRFVEPLKLDPEFERFFAYKTWFFIDPERFRFIMLFAIACMAGVYCLFLFVICLFLYQIQVNYKAQYVSNKLQQSLIVSTLAHCGVTAGLLLTPLFCYTGFCYLELRNSAQVMVVLLCLFSTHCLAEFMSTLLIITPYRRWVLGICSRRKVGATTATFPSQQRRSTLISR